MHPFCRVKKQVKRKQTPNRPELLWRYGPLSHPTPSISQPAVSPLRRDSPGLVWLCKLRLLQGLVLLLLCAGAVLESDMLPTVRLHTGRMEREGERRVLGDSYQSRRICTGGGAWGSLSAVVEAEPLPSYISRGEGLRIPPQHTQPHFDLLLRQPCSKNDITERECSEWHAGILFLQYAVFFFFF